MTTNNYQATVTAYADELRSLFAPQPAESRSAKPAALPADTLGSQLEELLGHHAADFDYRMKLQVLRLDRIGA